MYRDWLVESLEKTRKTQADLSRETGINHSVLNRMILGKRAIRDHEILKISRALGIPPPGENYAAQSPASVIEVPVTFVLERGVWREAGTATKRPTRSLIFSVSLERHRPEDKYMEAVELDNSSGESAPEEYYNIIPIAHWTDKIDEGQFIFGEINKNDFLQYDILELHKDNNGLITFLSCVSKRVWSEASVRVIGILVASTKQYARR